MVRLVRVVQVVQAVQVVQVVQVVSLVRVVNGGPRESVWSGLSGHYGSILSKRGSLVGNMVLGIKDWDFCHTLEQKHNLPNYTG